MTAEQIFAALTREPFRRFSVSTDSGREYLIDDPDTVSVGPKVMHLLERPATFVTLDLSHVNAVEPPRLLEDIETDPVEILKDKERSSRMASGNDLSE